MVLKPEAREPKIMSYFEKNSTEHNMQEPIWLRRLHIDLIRARRRCDEESYTREWWPKKPETPVYDKLSPGGGGCSGGQHRSFLVDRR